MIITYICFVNVMAFIIMGLDKWKAKKQAYRIPERTFWGVAILGGAIGAGAGMKTFRHKTKHRSFTIGIPFLIIIQVTSVALFILMS